MRSAKPSPLKIALVILIGLRLIVLQLIQDSPKLTAVLALGLALAGLGLFFNWLLRRLHKGQDFTGFRHER